MLNVRALALSLFLVTLGVAPAAARDPARIAITPELQRAAIILKAELLPIPPTYRTSYRIGLQRYEAAEQRLMGGPYGGNYVFAARRNSFVDGYMVLEVEPGTYAFRDLSRQDYWALCFNDNSLQFTVRPGEVVYLGEIDARHHVTELERMAVMSGRTSTRSQVVHFFDGVSPPAFKPVDEAGLDCRHGDGEGAHAADDGGAEGGGVRPGPVRHRTGPVRPQPDLRRLLCGAGARKRRGGKRGKLGFTLDPAIRAQTNSPDFPARSEGARDPREPRHGAAS